MSTPFAQRLRALRSAISRQGLAALVVTNPKDWYYLTGFTGDSGVLVILLRESALITDGRFMAQAREETSGVQILAQQAAPLPTAVELLRRKRAARVGFHPSELTVAQLAVLRKAGGSRVRWSAAAGLVEALRMRKEPVEIARIRKAARLTATVLQDVLPLLRPGVREIEIAAEIDHQMRLLGASGPAFETIVAFGERSAYPHARPSSRRLRKNELVVLDLGAILGHYCGDLTRTVFAGRAPERVRRWHRAVQQAQAAAVAAVRVGVPCGEVDAAARRVLASSRLDQYFVHSTGHGLGLEVHEAPRIARGQKQALAAGNVITIEPGVYVPGVGGIRIEDDVVVHADRAEMLTRVTRDLIEI